MSPICRKSTTTTLERTLGCRSGFERSTSLCRLTLVSQTPYPQRIGTGVIDHVWSTVRPAWLHVDSFSSWPNASSRINEAGESFEALEKGVNGTGDLWAWQHEFGERLLEPTAFEAWPLGSWTHCDSCSHFLSTPQVWFSGQEVPHHILWPHRSW